MTINEIIELIGNTASVLLVLLFIMLAVIAVRFMMQASRHEKEDAERKKKADELSRQETELRIKELQQIAKRQ